MGSCPGVGGEDGCSDGGAVRVSVDRRFPRARVACVAFVVVASVGSFFVTACSRQKAQQPPDAGTLLQAVVPADPAKLPSLEESKHWSNPYLIIRPQVVGLLSGAAANEEQILKPEEVLKALAELPVSAWPYGRAVAILVDAKRTSSEEDKIALRRNRGIVAGELQSAHVAIQWIPSS
jgi:hypothetical protein